MKRLSKLKAHEVSLVSRAANRKSYLIFKSKDGAPMPEKTLTQQLALTPEDDARINALIAERVSRVEKAEGVAPLDERAQASLKAVYRILLPMKDIITADDVYALLDEAGIGDDDDEASDETDGVDPADAAEVALDKSGDNPNNKGDDVAKDAEDSAKVEKAAGKMMWDGETPKGMSADKHAKAMKAAQAAYKAFGCDDKTEKAADDDEEGVEKAAPWMKEKGVTKSADALAGVPAEARAWFEAVTKRADEANRALVQKSAALEAEVKGMREERVLKSYHDQLNGQFRHLPINVEKTARVLKTLSETDKEAHDDYLSTLKAANEAARVSKSFGQGGLYGSMGSTPGAGAEGRMTSGGSSAETQLEALVDGYVAKSSDRVSKADAWAKVLATDEGIRLYEQIAIDQGGR